MNLFDLSQHGDANQIDPARLTHEGKIYENKNKRFTNEKAVITDTFGQA
jgi:pantothenate kinase